MNCIHRIATVVAAVAVLAACGTPAVVSYKGQPVATINPMTMTCGSPYALTQGCASGNAANLRTMAGDLPVRVSASADGRTILVGVDTTTNPSQQNMEFAADAVHRVGASRGARLLKVEALNLGGTVTGYVMHFDQDVYTELRRTAITR